MQSPYIPSTDADFSAWLDNFATLLTGTPLAFGLTAPIAVIVQAANDAFQTAYLATTNPGTRTPAAIAAKDAARAAATATVRPYAVSISRDAAVSDSLKTEIGVNLQTTSRTPIPAPTTSPTLSHLASTHLACQLAYRDSTTPTSKAKPPGVTGIDIRVTLGTAPAVSPDAATPLAIATKSPQTFTFDSSDVGKVATVWGRWVTRSGPAGVAQPGPWSPAISFGVI